MNTVQNVVSNSVCNGVTHTVHNKRRTHVQNQNQTRRFSNEAFSTSQTVGLTDCLLTVLSWLKDRNAREDHQP